MNKGKTYVKNNPVLVNASSILYEGGATLDRILYPVGSIYMSVNSTNPNQLFGGTWQQITGRFLYCTNNSKELGGGNTTGSTVLDVSQIPNHRHNLGSGDGADLQFMGYAPETNSVGGNNYYFLKYAGVSSYPTRFITVKDTGGGQGHTHPQNLPPYFTVYCWYRVS